MDKTRPAAVIISSNANSQRTTLGDSHATKKIYQAYLSRWIRPHWQKYGLAEVRTIQVESWLRGLPLAKSSCAKIRNLMSVLFNHACRCELFDRNPIYLVHQGPKRRTIYSRSSATTFAAA